MKRIYYWSSGATLRVVIHQYYCRDLEKLWSSYIHTRKPVSQLFWRCISLYESNQVEPRQQMWLKNCTRVGGVSNCVCWSRGSCSTPKLRPSSLLACKQQVVFPCSSPSGPYCGHRHTHTHTHKKIKSWLRPEGSDCTVFLSGQGWSEQASCYSLVND